MSQTTINSFFTARKRPDDQHAAKRRKIAMEAAPSESPSETTETAVSVVTSAKDDHKFDLFSKNEVLGTPEDLKKTKSSNDRNHKSKMAAPDVQFNIGKKPPQNSAKKRLNIKFSKSGKLSPSKKSNVVNFEKRGFLSPEKVGKLEEDTMKNARKQEIVQEIVDVFKKSENQEKVEKVQKKLDKLTPQEIKAKIGTVNKLSDLKAQLKSLRKGTSSTEKPKHRRNLFDNATTKEPIKIELEVEKKPKSVSSPIKASPRKQIPAHVRYADLVQPDKYLPLPAKYKFLAEVFRCVDQIVSMKFNRKEIIRVTDIRPSVQNILRKNFTNQYLKQIKCVFPKAYVYAWEKICDRLGRHTGDYELHMTPNLSRVEADTTGLTLDPLNLKKRPEAMMPAIKVERVKIFQHSLLSIVKDYHNDFLENHGIEVQDDQLTKWHRDFEVESCPEIDAVDFPTKPEVEQMGNAKDMIAKLAGVNSRLENVLKSVEKQEVKEEVLESTQKPVIRKGLQGLPKHLIDKILAKEKEKRIKDMTQNKDERKDLEILKELVTLAPVIVNCHRNVRKGAAVPMDTLCKVTADSHGRKSVQEMTKFVEMFIKVVPECMEVKKYDKVEYVKLKKDSPDVNGIRAKLEALVAKQDVTK